MRFLIALGLGGLAGCSHNPVVRPEPEPVASAGAQARTAPGVVVAVQRVGPEQARSLVEALPEVKALSESTTAGKDGERPVRPVVWVRSAAEPGCVDSTCLHLIEAGDEQDDRARTGRLSFRVAADSGEITVHTLDEEGNLLGDLAYEAWRARRERSERYIRTLFAIPEVQAFDAMLRRVSGGKVWMTVRIDREPAPGCKGGDDDCGWFYYVGERHEDHTVRWQTYVIDDATGDISVMGYDLVRKPVRKPKLPAKL